MLDIEDRGRVRLLTLNRPDALNAFSEALYDATAQALIDSAADPDVAVVVLTGTGRAFCAGTDLVEMGARNPGGGGVEPGVHGFAGMIDQMDSFPKPFICAINGLAIGVGATMLGFADLAFMSSEARLRCPFSSLGVAPEAASSYTFPLLLGRQQAMWTLAQRGVDQRRRGQGDGSWCGRCALPMSYWKRRWPTPKSWPRCRCRR